MTHGHARQPGKRTYGCAGSCNALHGLSMPSRWSGVSEMPWRIPFRGLLDLTVSRRSDCRAHAEPKCRCRRDTPTAAPARAGWSSSRQPDVMAESMEATELRSLRERYCCTWKLRPPGRGKFFSRASASCDSGRRRQLLIATCQLITTDSKGQRANRFENGRQGDAVLRGAKRLADLHPHQSSKIGDFTHFTSAASSVLLAPAGGLVVASS